jgi:hypothetical protein
LSEHKQSKFAFISNTERQQYIYMPNEIFIDLHKAYIKEQLKSPSHIAFAYSYYFFIILLYRYCYYGIEEFTQAKIKECLGYAPNYQSIDYLIKKNGVLDQLGYTKTTKDYPVNWDLSEFGLEFETWSEIKSNYKDIKTYLNDRNFKIKYPIKAFHRTKESFQDNNPDGTFYDIQNTHGIKIDTFIEIMDNEQLGTTGFYLYAYLKYKNDIYKDGYCKSLENLEEETKIKHTTLIKYLKMLEEHFFLIVTRQPYIINANGEELNPNIYKTI